MVTPGDSPLLLGGAWHDTAPELWDGEPPRWLLFRTRRQAAAWAAAARKEHGRHSPDWRFRVVRVVERLEVER